MSGIAIAISLGKLVTLFRNRKALAVFAAASAKLALSGTALAAAHAGVGKLDEAQAKFLADFFDLIAGLGSNLSATEIDKALSGLDPAQLDHANQHFVRFTGCVIEALLKQVLEDREFNLLPTQRSAVFEEREALRNRLITALPQVPGQWLQFIHDQPEGTKPLAHVDYVKELSNVQFAQATGPAIPQDVLGAFLTSWLPGVLNGESHPATLAADLAKTIAPRVGNALTDAIATDHPAARAALAKSLLQNQAEFAKDLHFINEDLTGIADQQTQHRQQNRDEHRVEIAKIDDLVKGQQDHRLENRDLIGNLFGHVGNIEKLMLGMVERLSAAVDPKAEQAKIEALIAKGSPTSRLEAYRRSLRFAFSRYEELALDHIAAADVVSPNILDIFVHPACHPDHLRPEDIDSDERHRQGYPEGKALAKSTQDLITLLAQDDYRRTVLLADPGMGKSTLIQSLIAHLASGQPIDGAPQLNGHLPVPFVLRDLVHHLPQDLVDKWDWQSLVTAFLNSYARVPDAPPLCSAYQNEPDEFRALITSNPKVFFLIDGLDEIGDLNKRKQIVRAIREGIRWVSKEARWLITSRVIGYNEAQVDFVSGWHPARKREKNKPRSQQPLPWEDADMEMKWQIELWQDFLVPGTGWDEGLDFTQCINTHYYTDDEVARGLVRRDRPNLKCVGNAYAYRIPIARRLYLAPFDDARQEAFSHRWFQHRSTHDYSKELLSEVRQGYQEGVRIIARVPNLLCMMNMLKRSGKQLPDGRHALYTEITHYYLGGLEMAYRQKKILGLDCPFAAPERHRLLALLGAHMQHQRTAGDQETTDEEPGTKNLELETKNDSILISRPAIHILLVPVIQSLQDQHKVNSDHSAAELLDELLDHIASRSGLLIPRTVDSNGRYEFAFTHLSFLEYFCASHLCHQLDYQKEKDTAELKAIKAKRSFDEEAYERQYPRGPYPIQPSDFAALAAQPLWHEVLILLMEAHSETTASQQRDALLESLFPPLYANEDSYQQSAEPLLPLPAVELAVKLAYDRDLALPASLRQQWWFNLWRTKWQWPQMYLGQGNMSIKTWHIAPLLIAVTEYQDEVLHQLSLAYRSLSDSGGLMPERTLEFDDCQTLRTEALYQVQCLPQLESLSFAGCTSLHSTQSLPQLPSLKILYLQSCTGLESDGALQGLAGLDKLEHLYLSGCTGLRSTQGLGRLPALEILYMRDCTGLTGESALQGLTGLDNLYFLDLTGCTGLQSTIGMPSLPALKILRLQGCTGLKHAGAFRGLADLDSLEELRLDDCTGLRSTQDLPHLPTLTKLYLMNCTGIEGDGALQGLDGLDKLEELYLNVCTSLRSTKGLPPLPSLKILDLQYCTGLEGESALRGLNGVNNLEQLWLVGCTGLKGVDVKAVVRNLGLKCKVYGP